jgi:superfamily II DNA or RNA helicase
MKFQLRDYQREAIRGTEEQAGIHNWLFRDGRNSGIVVLPTGAGKTFTLVAYLEALRAKRKAAGENIRVLWIAHRDELIAQAAETFRKVNPGAYITSWVARRVVLDSGEKIPGPKDANGDIVVAMIASTKKLFEALDVVAQAKNCKYIVAVDECHHWATQTSIEIEQSKRTKKVVYSNMYERLYGELDKLKLSCGKIKIVDKYIGLTATPERLDKRPLKFEGIAYKTTFIDMVRRGYLAKPVLREMRTNAYAKLDVRGGEFTAQSLERLNTPRRNLAIAREIIDHRWRYGKTLVFCCSVQHTKDLKLAMDKYAAKRKIDAPPIRIIDGTASNLERNEVRNWLDAGPPREFKILLNCMVYTEGFDCPSLNSIVLARPTMSESLWMQMVGRGARIVKRTATYDQSAFSDFPSVGETGIFKSAKDPAMQAVGKTVDLLPGTTPRIVVERAIKDSFNLTIVSDDITRFSTLIKEWELHVSPEAVDDKERKKREDDKKHGNKVAKKLKDRKQIRRVEGDLEEAQLVNVQGILVVSTMYQSRIGIPLDEDRMDSIRSLHEFSKGCWIDWVDHTYACTRPLDPKTGDRTCSCPSRKIFDKDLFAQSYTFCVTSGSIPSKVWTKIMWSYYFSEIQHRKTMIDQHTKKVVPTWQWIPMKTITEDMKRASRVRVRKDLEQAGVDNARFNTEYAGRKKVIELYDKVFKQAMSDNKSVASVGALNLVHERIQKISAKDRRIVVRTDVLIEGERRPWIRRLYTFREAMSAAMRNVLNDSCCMVQAVAQNSMLRDQDAHQFGRKKPATTPYSGSPYPGGRA